MHLLYQRAPSDTKFLGFRATARSSPRFCFPTRRRAGCRFVMAVPHESENARQHAFPSYVACRTGRGVLLIPGSVGVRRERGMPFSFTSNVLVLL